MARRLRRAAQRDLDRPADEPLADVVAPAGARQADRRRRPGRSRGLTRGGRRALARLPAPGELGRRRDGVVVAPTPGCEARLETRSDAVALRVVGGPHQRARSDRALGERGDQLCGRPNGGSRARRCGSRRRRSRRRGAVRGTRHRLRTGRRTGLAESHSEEELQRPTPPRAAPRRTASAPAHPRSTAPPARPGPALVPALAPLGPARRRAGSRCSRQPHRTTRPRTGAT